ncbi:UNVERIFIED_CONTAM: yrkF [Trichonephila clavipes]
MRAWVYAGRMDYDVDLDCEGLLCPLPVLRARKRLMALAPGMVLRVRATDGMAAVDLPHFCAGAGHDYLGAMSEGTVTAHFIRCGAAQAEPQSTGME